ncbi:hypothetical protein [Streptomyces albogriseolus]|uniref:hypothetical protein n=1 Tax=Streptomyces albogriseolus TaxID=1887 RepID=UPI003460F4AD
MTAAAITLAAIAALLEIGGIVITIKDIQKARHRLAAYLRRPVIAHLGTAFVVATAMNARVEIGEQTLEQRIEALEASHRALAQDTERRDKALSKRLTERFEKQLAATTENIQGDIAGLRQLVAGEGPGHWWTGYRGPLILAVGVLVGLAGNIVGALPN